MTNNANTTDPAHSTPPTVDATPDTKESESGNYVLRGGAIDPEPFLGLHRHKSCDRASLCWDGIPADIFWKDLLAQYNFKEGFLKTVVVNDDKWGTTAESTDEHESKIIPEENHGRHETEPDEITPPFQPDLTGGPVGNVSTSVEW